MKKTIRQGILSLCMITIFSTSIAVPTLAAISETPQNVETLQNVNFQQEFQQQLGRFSHLSDDEIKAVLVSEYGLSREQVQQIYQEYLIAQSTMVYGFPSRPSEGDTYAYKTKKIALPTESDKKLMMIMSACSAISNPYVTAFGGAAALATVIFSLCPDDAKFVIATLNFTYGITNDGPLGWTPGYIDTKFYY